MLASLALASLALFAFAALGACAGARGSLDAVGESTKGARGQSSRDAGDGGWVDGAGALPSDYRSAGSGFTKVNKSRFVSQGHAAGRWEVDVYANEAAARALASRSRSVPPGAVIVQEHFERSAAPADAAEGKANGPIMVMEKRPPGSSKEHGDWRWAVVGSLGQLVKDGAIEACAGCHDDAPMDGLFPIVD